MQAGRLTAEELAAHFLARIEQLDRRGPELNSILFLNPDTIRIAKTAEALTAQMRKSLPRLFVPGR
jgi:amidase